MSNTETKKTTLEEAIAEWNNLKIERCEMPFDCGGDSMNDYHFEFYNDKDTQVESELIDSYFESQIWKEVNFYEASDGHYIGENGVVTITLNEEGNEFEYSKSAQSEWNETYSDDVWVKLTDKEVEFVNKYVLNIMGGEDSGSSATINYKADFIMTDEEEKIDKKLAQKVYDEACDFDLPNAEGEASDWFNFNTNEDNEEIEIEDNKLKVSVSRSYYVYRDSED